MQRLGFQSICLLTTMLQCSIFKRLSNSAPCVLSRAELKIFRDAQPLKKWFSSPEWIGN